MGDRTISSVCFSVYPWNTLAPSSVITTGCTRLHIFAAWRARMGTLTGTRRMRFSFSFSFSPPAALRVPHREDPGKAFMNQSAMESTATCVAMDTQGWRMCRGFARNVSKAMYAWTCFRTMAYSRNRMAANHARYPKTLLGEGDEVGIILRGGIPVRFVRAFRARDESSPPGADGGHVAGNRLATTRNPNK